MSIYDKASLVLIPSGTKTSKVYSQKPVNGDGDFTFSRSTAATRVNADGNIEKETQNLLLQSNSFTTGWTTSDASVTSGESGYDGSSDAWRLEATATASFARIERNISASGVNTLSIYAKAGNVDFLAIADQTNAKYYDLANGTLGADVGTNISSNITSVGGGWYRCEYSTSASLTNFRVYISNANGSVAVNSGEYIYIQDAQVEQGLVARDYIETTTAAVEGGITDNVPRLDYTDSSCPALLLEPQRTNVFTNSEYFNGSDWILQDATITNNSAISPEGVQNASLYTSSSDIYDFVRQNISFVSGTTYTYSVFAKAGTSSLITLAYHSAAFGTGQSVEFDLSDGTYTIGNGTPSVKVEDFGDGWYRCAITATATAASTRSTGFSNTAAGAVTTLYLYGAQMEASASYATSYIPTYGTSVTRDADYSVRSDMQDYVGVDEGTWFMHFKDLFFDITGTGQGAINLVYNSGNQIEFIQDGNLQYKITINNSIAIENLDGEDKVAIAWSTSGLVIYINGVSRYTSASSQYANPYDTFELTRIDRRPRVDIKQILFFKTRLSNEELAALTTI